MEILRLLKRCIIRRRSKDISLLEGLPNEIIQHINTFLPLPTAAAFALCSRRLYFVLGTSSWEKLIRTQQQQQQDKERQFNDRAVDTKLTSWRDFRDPPRQGEREEFLSLLDRDLPKLIFCCQCAILHPADLRYQNERLCARLELHIYYRQLCFPRIQMAMKRYRLGLDHRRQLYWFSSHFTLYVREIRNSTHENVEARIAHGKFLVRSQYWIVVPMSELKLSLRVVKDAYVCEHFPSMGRSTGLLQEMLICRMSHWKEQNIECSKCSGLKQCPQCNTEFQIDARQLSSRGFTIVVTKWWDMGPGISPYDTEYREHCYYFDRSHRKEDPRVDFEPGSIQGAFEDQKGFSFDVSFKAKQSRLVACIPRVSEEIPQVNI